MQIPINRFPSLAALVNDYYYAFSKVSEFYNGDFRDSASYLAQAESVRTRLLPRERLAAVLREQNNSYGCGLATLENIETLVQEQTCVVVTGQQVGLFSGPLYTIYKALTAIKLAAALSQNHGKPFVPIFWMAAEDHDFVEVNHLSLLDQDSRLQNIAYQEHSAELKIPVAKILFSSTIETCLQRLDELTPSSEFKPAVLAELRQAYQPERSFVEAFAQWMTFLFKSKCALRASKQLSQKGYVPQVQQREGKLNLFLAEHERLTVECRDSGFAVKGDPRSFTQAELVELLHRTPHVFSPNVLLRPVYQDTLLPTVAYVGGPGEIAYFAQLKEVYAEYGLSMPVI